jgi:hypothetical protein
MQGRPTSTWAFRRASTSRANLVTRAAALLAAELAHPSWIPQHLALSGVTDAYQPIEKKLQLTRSCLRILAEFRNPVFVVTKNHLVARDADYLAELAGVNASAVSVSITTLDPGLEWTSGGWQREFATCATLLPSSIQQVFRSALTSRPLFRPRSRNPKSRRRRQPERITCYTIIRPLDGCTDLCRMAGEPFSGSKGQDTGSNSGDPE